MKMKHLWKIIPLGAAWVGFLSLPLEAFDGAAAERELKRIERVGAADTRQAALRTLVGNNGGINARDEQEHTLLHIAAQGGLTKAVEGLLVIGDIDVNSKDAQGRTPLHIAAQQSRTEVVEALLGAAGIVVNEKDRNGDTPLFLAAQGGSAGVVERLLAVNAIDIRGKNTQDRTFLHIAAQGGLTKVVESLLATADVDVNAVDRDGCTALWPAAMQGNVLSMRAILKHPGVEVNAVSTSRGCPLLYALAGTPRDRVGAVRELLTKPDVGVNWKDAQGHTALWVSIDRGNVDVARALLARPDIAVDEVEAGRTLLHLAAGCRRDSAELIQAILGKPGVNLHAQDSRRDTPLWHAFECGNGRAAKVLLERGATAGNRLEEQLWRIESMPMLGEGDAQREDDAGRTDALTRIKKDVLRENINTPDARGHTLLHLAVRCGYVKVVGRLMTFNDVNVNAKDAAGHTPLWWSFQNQYPEIAELLLAKGAQGDFGTEAVKGRLRTIANIEDAGRREADLRKLVTDCGGINARDAKGNTLLHVTVRLCDEQLIRRVVLFGSAAAHSVGKGLRLMIKDDLLTFPDIDVNAKDKQGNAALHLYLSLSILTRNFGGLDAEVVDAFLARPELDINARGGVHMEGGKGGAKTVLDYAIAGSGYNAIKDHVLPAILGRADLSVAMDGRGYTALHRAAAEGNPECLGKLLGNEIFLNAIDVRELVNYDTALFQCLGTGEWGRVEALLARGAKVGLQNGKGENAFLMAFRGLPATVLEDIPGFLQRLWDKLGQEVEEALRRELGLDAGQALSAEDAAVMAMVVAAKVTEGMERGEAALHRIAKSEAADNMEWLLAKLQEKARLAFGLTEALPVRQALSPEEAAAVRAAIVWNTGEVPRATDLHRAAAAGNLEEVRRLLAGRTVDINAIDEQGKTALQVAKYLKRYEIVRALLDAGAEVAVVDEAERGTLQAAAMNNRFEVVRGALKRLRERAEEALRQKRGPRAVLGESDKRAVAACLADSFMANVVAFTATVVNAADASKDTALHVAARMNRLKAVQALLKIPGINVDAKNLFGRTPLFMAAGNGFVEIVKELLGAGADVRFSSRDCDCASLGFCCCSVLHGMFYVLNKEMMQEALNALDRSLRKERGFPEVGPLSPDQTKILAESLRKELNATDCACGKTVLRMALSSVVRYITAAGIAAEDEGILFDREAAMDDVLPILKNLLDLGCDVEIGDWRGVMMIGEYSQRRECVASQRREYVARSALHDAVDAVESVKVMLLLLTYLPPVTGEQAETRAALLAECEEVAKTDAREASDAGRKARFAAMIKILEAFRHHGTVWHAVAAAGDLGYMKWYLDLRKEQLTAQVRADLGDAAEATEVEEKMKRLLMKDINVVGADGYTPLHLAAESGYWELVKLLLDNRALIDAKTTAGRTVLDLVEEKGKLDALKEWMAGATISGDTGRSALYLAVWFGNSEMTRNILSSKNLVIWDVVAAYWRFKSDPKRIEQVNRDVNVRNAMKFVANFLRERGFNPDLPIPSNDSDLEAELRRAVNERNLADTMTLLVFGYRDGRSLEGAVRVCLARRGAGSGSNVCDEWLQDFLRGRGIDPETGKLPADRTLSPSRWCEKEDVYLPDGQNVLPAYYTTLGTEGLPLAVEEFLIGKDVSFGADAAAAAPHSPAAAYFTLPKEVRSYLQRLGFVEETRATITFRRKLSLTHILHHGDIVPRDQSGELLSWGVESEATRETIVPIRLFPIAGGGLRFDIQADWSKVENAPRVASLPNGFFKRRFPQEARDPRWNLRLIGRDKRQCFAFASLAVWPDSVRLTLEVVPPEDFTVVPGRIDIDSILSRDFSSIAGDGDVF